MLNVRFATYVFTALMVHSAHAMYCGDQINSPDAGEPSGTNWAGGNSEALQKQKFLACNGKALLQVNDPAFKLGPQGSNDSFNVAIKAYLSKGAGPKERDRAASAIHMMTMLKSGAITQHQFAWRWQRDWCKAAIHKPMAQVPAAPELAAQLQALNPASIGIAHEIVVAGSIANKPGCDAAVKAWLARAVK